MTGNAARVAAQSGASVHVLGIDPGYGELGWGFVLDRPGNRREVLSSGWLLTDRSRPVGARMDEVVAAVTGLLDAGPVDVVAIEDWTYQGPRSHGPNTMHLPELIGRIVQLCASHGNVGTVSRIPTTGIKRHLGARTKGDVQRVLRFSTKGQRPTSEHAWDAVAAAVCWRLGR